MRWVDPPRRRPFEEVLHEADVTAAPQAVHDAEVLVVGGMTLSVHPAAGMVQYCRGRDLVVVDLEPAAFDARADLLIHAELGEVLGEAAGVE